MSIFDVFTFKKEALKVFTAENVKEVFDKARAAIIAQAKENFPGEEKKKAVDAIIICVIEGKTKDCNNKLVLWVVDLLKKAVPTITQAVYNFLKEKVEEL